MKFLTFAPSSGTIQYVHIFRSSGMWMIAMIASITLAAATIHSLPPHDMSYSYVLICDESHVWINRILLIVSAFMCYQGGLTMIDPSYSSPCHGSCVLMLLTTWCDICSPCSIARQRQFPSDATSWGVPIWFMKFLILSSFSFDISSIATFVHSSWDSVVHKLTICSVFRNLSYLSL